jgi:hypothetical protein
MHPARRLALLLLLAAPLLASPAFGQSAPPTAEQLKSWVTIRQQRVDLLREEIRQSDARMETQIDDIVRTLTTIRDSKDSRTKVARIKEDTGKRLAKTIQYYDQKRAALKEELRNPRLHLTEAEKRQMIAAFDTRIEKRTQQILALNKSMPTHEDHERYRATGGGWWGTQYERNEEYDQNRRMTTHSNTQRDAIQKQLDASIARLSQQSRTLKSQLAAAAPDQRKAISDEIAKTDALVAERRKQKTEIAQPSGLAVHTVALKEATDMDKALQQSIEDLRREFNTLFQRYNTYLGELSALHQTEAALAAKQGKK